MSDVKSALRIAVAYVGWCVFVIALLYVIDAFIRLLWTF